MSENNATMTVTQGDVLPVKARFLELADEKTFLREASFACQLMNANPYLARGSKASLQQAVLNVAQLGLSLHPSLKLAYLVPRWSKKTNGVEVSLEASYQGLVKLLTDCGTVKQIEARIIYDGDERDIDFAYPEKVRTHKPYALTGKPRGEMCAVYSLATLHDGSKSIEIMSKDEVHEVRERSESYKKSKDGVPSIWLTDEAEMWRKTVIRRHFKYLPKSGNVETVGKAIELDNDDYTISYAQLAMVERLLTNAEIDSEKKQDIENELPTMSSAQAASCIKWLRERQPRNVPQMMGALANGDAPTVEEVEEEP